MRLINSFLVIIFFFFDSAVFSQNITCSFQGVLTDEAVVDIKAENCNIIQGNTMISSEVDLSELTSITQFDIVLISTEEGLEAFNTLPNVEYVKALQIYNLEKIQKMNSLGNVQKISALYIQGCASLTQFSGIDNLLSLGSLHLTNNDALKSIGGFDSLEEIDLIYLVANKELESLSGFQNLENVNSLIINFNNNLKTITGFQKIKTVANDFQVVQNPSLNSVNGFSNMKQIGSLMVGFNSKLTNVAFLQNTELISRSLRIQGNDNLKNLYGLSHLSSLLGSIWISNNTNLSCDSCTSKIASNLLKDAKTSGLGVAVPYPGAPLPSNFVQCEVADTSDLSCNENDIPEVCNSGSCEIFEGEDIIIIEIKDPDVEENIFIGANQQLVIASGNLTLNGFNVTFEFSGSTVDIKEGCLNASSSVLEVDISSVIDITKDKKSELDILTYQCLSAPFEEVVVSTGPLNCISSTVLASQTKYTIILDKPTCNGAPHPSYSIVMLLLSIIYYSF